LTYTAHFKGNHHNPVEDMQNTFKWSVDF